MQRKSRSSQVAFYACVLGPSLVYGVVCVAYLGPQLYADASTFSSWHLLLGCFILLSLVVHYSVSMLGMLCFGAPTARNARNLAKLSRKGWNRSKRVIFCFVSQGLQQEVLKRSVAEALEVGTRFGVIFEIEVVVDSAVPTDPIFSHPLVSVVEVPREFQTPRRSRFKARSLCYAAMIRASRRDDLSDCWVVHCDEDTVVTPQCIAGIAAFLEQPSSASLCGAGEIKYNSVTQGVGRVFNVIDYHRTGEDVGRYRLQFAAFKEALFGAHGSFVVVPALIEQQVQFDFGPKGSIAEDIYFCLRLRELGIPCVWIDGYVREQSPGDFRNFVRQRARWIEGLLNVCFDGGFSVGKRAILLAYLLMWRTTIVAGIVLLVVLSIGSVSLLAVALWGLDMAIMGTVILVGALRNMEEDGSPSVARVLGAVGGSFVLTPVVCLFETIAVVYGVAARRNEFFVVQKRNLAAEPIAIPSPL